MIFNSGQEFNQKPVIKVIGVGGGGGNAIDRMIENDVKGVTFVAINTDSQVLKLSKADERLQIGKKLTRGLGAGAKPEVGKEAAIESLPEIEQILDGCDMIFITAGMGGGTGTGAAAIIAEASKKRGILTIGIVTKPFAFEGPVRMQYALEGIDILKPHVDTLIVIPNERLLLISGPETQLLDAFRESDRVLRQGVQGISDLINFAGLINVDFADVRTVMENKGSALMGIGMARGENRAVQAARNAIHSELLEMSIDGATDAIVNITSGTNITLFETQEALSEIRNAADKNLNVIYGTTVNNDFGDEMIVTVIATGYELKGKTTVIENIAKSTLKEQPKVSNQTKIKETTYYDEVEELPKQQKSNISLPGWLSKNKKI